jgi:hypothetical protein
VRELLYLGRSRFGYEIDLSSFPGQARIRVLRRGPDALLEIGQRADGGLGEHAERRGHSSPAAGT